jgi:hypothetical protein
MTTKQACEGLYIYCSLCLSCVSFVQAYLLKYTKGSDVSLISLFNAFRLETKLYCCSALDSFGSGLNLLADLLNKKFSITKLNSVA